MKNPELVSGSSANSSFHFYVHSSILTKNPEINSG
jgi:hypothetical protein